MRVMCIKDYHVFGEPDNLLPGDRPLYPILKGKQYDIYMGYQYINRGIVLQTDGKCVSVISFGDKINEEIEDYFVPVDKWREIQINKLDI